MITIGSFALLRPLWLLALLALLLLLRLTLRRDLALGDWRRAIDAPLLSALLRRQGDALSKRRHAAINWCVALIAFALSGPAVKSADATQFRNLDVTLILLDVSHAESLPQVIAAAQLILAGSGARQTGLLLYAGDAYVASPLTDDVAALEALLFAIDSGTVPDGGTRPDRALRLAGRVLRETGAFAADVALISDGEGVDARAQAEASALADKGHRLHTLVTGRKASAAEAIRRDAMAALAVAGRGIAGERAQPENVANAIAGRKVEHVTKAARHALEWRDYGRFLLLLAAAPLILYMRAGAS